MQNIKKSEQHIQKLKNVLKYSSHNPDNKQYEPTLQAQTMAEYSENGTSVYQCLPALQPKCHLMHSVLHHADRHL